MTQVNGRHKGLPGRASGRSGSPLEQAIALHRAGRPREAVALYEAHLTCHPDDAEALFLAGTARYQSGGAEPAESLFRRAAAIAPGIAQIHNNHGLALAALGRNEEALISYREALRLDPAFSEALSNLGSCLVNLGRRQEAIATFRRAVEHAPRLAVAHSNLGMALKGEGHAKDAEACFRRAVAADPHCGDAHANLCSLLLERGDGHGALAACDAYLSAFPGHSGALAFKTVALRQVDRSEDAEAIIDFDRLFWRAEHTFASGYTSIDAFNDAIEAHVLNHRSLRREPPNKSTRLGWHTGDLVAGGTGPIAILETMIRRAAEQHLAAVKERAGHPFRVPPSLAGTRVAIWSVVMERGGHEIPHIHPEAWLSGVYYPRVPEAMARSTEGHRGWIGFGRPAEIYPIPAPAEVRWVLPTEGLMVLMPSYYFHETGPLSGDARRISVAFDIFLPKA